MKLLTYNNFKLSISDEAYMISAFRKLHDMDESNDKSKFVQQMSILYFVYDPRSTYSYIVDEDSRLKEVLEQEGIDPKKFVITKEFKEAIDVYKKLNTTASTELLNDTKITIDKVRNMLKSIDFDQLDEKEKVNAIKTITSIVSMLPKLIRELTEVEKVVSKELEEESKARGNVAKTIFDDGINIE